jgi:glucose-1-phosphate cytidylyltransferase
VKTVILCGGRGSRAYPHTEAVPKPLLDVGGQPILRHVMEIFASQGHREFILATGYLGEQIARYAEELPGDWEVTTLDTGADTGTAERVALCRPYLGERFMVTYGDGVGDVDLARLLGHHLGSGATATLTTVPLPSPYGTVDFAGDGRVLAFHEKPILRDHWINAGFFVFERSAFDCWRGEDLEREVLPGLAAAGRLYAYRHSGFWSSMDTYKDALRLASLCRDGEPPWLPRPRGSKQEGPLLEPGQ